jgi:hypothetical protein
VIHFQSPADFESTIANLARWVKPGGLVLVLASSFYNKCLMQGPDGRYTSGTDSTGEDNDRLSW